MKRLQTARKLRGLALLLALTLTFTACGPSGSQSGAPASGESGKDEPVTVTFAQKTDPSTLDPHRASSNVGAYVYENICESLVKYDARDVLQPVLAESWERTGDNEWTFHLKKDVKFSNGEEFNAEAVAWNVKRALNKEFPRKTFEFAPYYEACEAVDETTVRFITTHPDFNFPARLINLVFIAPVHSDKIGEEAISQDPVGTGPYTLTSWERDQKITLSARDDYWGGRPEVDTFVIATIPEETTQVAELQAGRIDLIIDVPFEMEPVIKGKDGVHTDYRLSKRVPYVGFNTTEWSPSAEIQNPKVRQAIGYAIDRESILQNILGGYGEIMPSVYRPDFPAYDASYVKFNYDPEKAKSLLTEAGYPDGFSITLQTSSGGSVLKGVEVAQAIAKNLQDVGIRCDVEVYEYNVMRSIVIGGQDQKKVAGLYLWSWTSAPEAFDTHLSGYLMYGGQSSYNRLEGYDELGQRILDAASEEEQKPLLIEMQQKLYDDPPITSLYMQGQIFGVSDRLDWSAKDTTGIYAKEMKIKS